MTKTKSVKKKVIDKKTKTEHAQFVEGTLIAKKMAKFFHELLKLYPVNNQAEYAKQIEGIFAHLCTLKFSIISYFLKSGFYSKDLLFNAFDQIESGLEGVYFKLLDEKNAEIKHEKTNGKL